MIQRAVHNIGWAVAQLKQGFIVRRPHWPPKRWIALAGNLPEVAMASHWIYTQAADGKIVLYTPSPNDLLAEDWEYSDVPEAAYWDVPSLPP